MSQKRLSPNKAIKLYHLFFIFYISSRISYVSLNYNMHGHVPCDIITLHAKSLHYNLEFFIIFYIFSKLQPSFQ